MVICSELNLQRYQMVFCKRERKKKMEKGRTKKGKNKKLLYCIELQNSNWLDQLNLLPKVGKTFVVKKSISKTVVEQMQRDYLDHQNCHA